MDRDYQDILSRNEKIKWVLPEHHWKAMDKVNRGTVDALKEQHLSQMRENIRSGLWAKHGAMSTGLSGLGRNKAVIGIGAGGSLRKNKDVLISLYRANTMRKLDDQAFFFMVCNHMYRPCLKDGLHPHFVSLIDGSDVVFDQLNKKIPPNERTILLTGLHAHPKVLREWDRQGRPISFYVGASEEAKEIFQKETGEDPTPYICEEGGNVLNCMWLFSMKMLHSRVFMITGNDLSYPINGDLESRRKAYYADQDYSSNIANHRDEARYNFGWMAYEHEFNPIIDKWVMNLKPVGTSWQLWTYKRWLESQVTMHENDKVSWRIYNCSEGGILGVVSKDDTDPEKMYEKNNWTLMDEIAPRRWRTKRLIDAADEFLRARSLICRPETNGDVMCVNRLPVSMDIAKSIVRASV